MPVLVPGAHVRIATNPLGSQYVLGPSCRLPSRSVGRSPRSEGAAWWRSAEERPWCVPGCIRDAEIKSGPWCLSRKPIEGRVQDNLRNWKTGGLRRLPATEPSGDLIESSSVREVEKGIALHQSLKPQQLMRQLVRAALPWVRTKFGTRSWAQER